MEAEGVSEDEEVDGGGRALVYEVERVELLIKEEASGLGAVALVVEIVHDLLERNNVKASAKDFFPGSR